ncbi:uncharacterized protein LOC120300062 [Crotalus tigris]|uniref:uncharacterized protein LOC120300062 n=1 Tax=Crotalus tigris TaxID=88082 RepID=UPI00192F97BF|nr:uncharacterized protein LOC120300062 [Crotalus tigris]
MSKPQYKKMEEDVPEVQNPPPYVENQPAPSGFLAPPQYQPPSDPRYNQGLVIQPTQTMNFVRLQPTKEPDYMAYSIFTMLCCCLPLGIAALIYSIQHLVSNSCSTSSLQNVYVGTTPKCLEHYVFSYRNNQLLLQSNGKQTQEANRTGNAESARRNSKLSRNLSHAALGVGLGSLTLYIIFVVFMYTQRASLLIDNPYTISP